VDVTTGEGLEQELAGIETVIDVTSPPTVDETTPKLFAAATRNILRAEERTGVRHHVLLSIVGIDRVQGNPHIAGKRAQEELVTGGPIPYTIQRATQFFEFTAGLIEWMRHDDVVTLPPLLIQPLAASDAGEVLAEIATRDPAGRVPDLAGPEPQDLIDMARRLLQARGEHLRIVPSWRTGLFGNDVGGEALLPGSGARIAPTTFDTWLAAQTPAHV
jgi:uncharacterized protein YbjT (DUF2867 family)